MARVGPQRHEKKKALCYWLVNIWSSEVEFTKVEKGKAIKTLFSNHSRRILLLAILY